MTGSRAGAPGVLLMAYIDDASRRVFARFYDYEGTRPAMDSFQRYIRQYGIPLAVYADWHTTYQSSATPTVEEQLAGMEPMSQCGRALGEVGGELILAYLPQAKGRIERLFHTFQDRVIKEMRLAEVSTLEVANRFLAGYLPMYNQRFSVSPAQTADLHRPRLARRELDRILCLKTTRCLRKDFTIAHQGGALSDPRQYPGHPRARGSPDRWDETDHTSRSAARLSRDHSSSREDGGGPHGPPATAPGHADAGSSVAHTAAAGTRATSGSGHYINRTFLYWVTCLSG